MSIKNLLFSDLKKAYVALFLIFFSVCIAVTFDDKARNLLLVGFMTFSAISCFLYRFVVKSDVYLFFFIFCIFSFPVLAHDTPPRWSTVIYSLLFCLSFVAFIRAYIVSKFNVDDFIVVLKFLIIAYVVVLIIQQISVLLGITPLNIRNYNILDPFKLNSLGAEPSWSSRIIALLFYCYLTMREVKLGRAYKLSRDMLLDKWVWFAFLWSMLTMLSGTAILFLAIVFLKFARLKSILFVITFFILSIVVFESFEFEPYQRARDVAVATVTLDEQKIIEADHSASFRIVPLLVLAKSVGISSFEDYFGHGIDSVATNLDFNLGITASSSTFLGFWYEFGFIAFITFILFSFKLSVNSLQSFIFWFFLVFMYGLNTQIPWLAIMLLYITKNLTSASYDYKNSP